MSTDPGLARLARRVTSRRVTLGMRTQRALAAAMGVTERVVNKIETGHSVSQSTYAALAITLQWSPDSVSAVIGGGEPAELSSGTRQPPLVSDNWDDENVRKIWALRIDEAQRLALVRTYLAGRDAENGVNGPGAVTAGA